MEVYEGKKPGYMSGLPEGKFWAVVEPLYIEFDPEQDRYTCRRAEAEDIAAWDEEIRDYTSPPKK